MLKNKKDIRKWLEFNEIRNYVINGDLSIDCHQNVKLIKKISPISKEEGLPVKFRIVHGDFICAGLNLKSLYGCPDEVKGKFNCNDNLLENLEFSPKIISSDYLCKNNKLKNLKGCPSVIHGWFNCSSNQLTSFDYFPKQVHSLMFEDNNIKEELLINFKVVVVSSVIESDFGDGHDFFGNNDFNKKLNKVKMDAIIKEKEELLNVSEALSKKREQKKRI